MENKVRVVADHVEHVRRERRDDDQHRGVLEGPFSGHRLSLYIKT